MRGLHNHTCKMHRGVRTTYEITRQVEATEDGSTGDHEENLAQASPLGQIAWMLRSQLLDPDG